MQQLIINPESLPIVEISPIFRGLISPIDLLKSEGQIAFQAQFTQQPQGELFRVIDQDFHFITAVHGSQLIIQRNNEAVSLDITQVLQVSNCICFVVNWSPRHLRLLCGNPDSTLYDTEEQTTRIVIPPPSLVEWAIRQNLLPINEYNSEEEFRQRIYSSLISLKDNITRTGAINPFWNISYNGNAITGRLPKRETDIHPTIHSLLYNEMLMGAIRVIPERQTGIGDLDFSFVGSVRGRGTCEIFIEFKLAHSQDVYHGLENQLPTYLRNQNIRYAAYCVLWFKCEWFNEPASLSLQEMEQNLISRSSQNSYPGIRVFTFDFGKKATAST